LVERSILPRIIQHEYEIGALMTLGAKIKGEPLTFDVADPSIDTPSHIKKAMIEALCRPDATHYTRIRGLPEFVTSVSEFYHRFGVQVDPNDEVLATAGSGEGLYIVFASMIAPKDEFILPNPTFPTYFALLDILGGVAKSVPTKADFHLDTDAIRKEVTRKTKAIVLCNPNNPTGAVYDKPELKEVLEIAEENDLIIISDENYCQLIYDDKEYHTIASLPNAMERTIVVSGLSKAYAMTGWRLGFVIAKKEFTELFEKLAFEITGSVNTAVQYAGAEALRTKNNIIAEIVNQYDRKRELTVRLLKEAGLRCHMPEGGFEAFPQIPTGFKDSMEFAKFLVERVGVLVKPGRFFGPEGRKHFRVVYCKDEKVIEEGLKRIKEALASPLGKQ
jgi:aminotransferase